MMELTRRRLWFAVFVVVVFTTGLTAGIALDRYFTFGGPPAFGRPPGFRAPFGEPRRARGPGAADIVDRMSRELDLSAGQKAQLQAIFERGGDRMAKFQASTRREFEAVRRQIDAEIVAILTPEQRVKFNEQRSRRRPPRGPEGVPPPP